MTTNQTDKSSTDMKPLQTPGGEQVQNSEYSTSCESQQSRKDKLCSQLDELCHFFEVKQLDKTKQKDATNSRQVEATANLINQIIKNLEYENFNSKFFGNGQGNNEEANISSMKRMNKLQGKFMCDLPLTEELAMKYHGKVKNIIRVFKVQMKDFGFKENVRIIQDQLQRVKICHANRRRQREHREQNKQYREEFFQNVRTADHTPTSDTNNLVVNSIKPQMTTQSYQSGEKTSVACEQTLTPQVDEALLQTLKQSQETIQMDHLKILNTNMMLEICSNELQIAIKEQNLDMHSIQEKISNILQQINKQKLLLFNNFQVITKCFGQQRQAVEQSGYRSSTAKTTSSLLNKRMFADSVQSFDKYNNASWSNKIQRCNPQDLQIDKKALNEKLKNAERTLNCFQQLQSTSSILSDIKQACPQEDMQDMSSESFMKLEPCLQFNQPLKLNIDQKYELEQTQANLIKSNSQLPVTNYQVLEQGKQFSSNEQMSSESQQQIAGQNNINAQKKSIWMNQSEYQEMKKITGQVKTLIQKVREIREDCNIPHTPSSNGRKSSCKEGSECPAFQLK